MEVIVPIIMFVFFTIFFAFVAVMMTVGKRRANSQNKTVQRTVVKQVVNKVEQKPTEEPKPDHAHIGEAETYQPIVGSLGAVSDEGCAELDGVRLIEDDEAYDLPIEADRPAIAKAVILGELLNTPRFKTPWNPKK